MYLTAWKHEGSKFGLIAMAYLVLLTLAIGAYIIKIKRVRSGYLYVPLLQNAAMLASGRGTHLEVSNDRKPASYERSSLVVVAS